MKLTSKNMTDMRNAFEASIKDPYGAKEERTFYIKRRAFQMHTGGAEFNRMVWITDLKNNRTVAIVCGNMDWNTMFIKVVADMKRRLCIS